MNESALTNEQIESLFLFCRQHYVEYFDLQIELVDHLASAIESKMEKKPDLSFDDARVLSFREFGFGGFSKIKQEKKRALEKRYRNITFQYFLSFFKLPKIILTILLTIVFSVLLHFTPSDGEWYLFLLLFLMLGSIIYSFYLFPKYYKIHLIPGKKFLLIDQFNKVQSTLVVWPVLMLNISVSFFNFGKDMVFTPAIEVLFSFFLIVLALFLYVSGFYLPFKIKEHFTAQFPQFVKA